MFGGLPWVCIWPMTAEHEPMQVSVSVNDEHAKTKQGQSNIHNTHNDSNNKKHDKDTEEIVKGLTDWINSLDAKNKDLTTKNDMLWRQSAEVFRKATSTKLENFADPFPTLKLVEGFKCLYTDDWCDLWEEGEDDCATIADLSRLMEHVNKVCVDRANQQIISFLGLDKEDNPPSRKQYPDVYHLRRIKNISEQKVSKFTKKLVTLSVDEWFAQGIFKSTIEECEFKENVKSFYEKFAYIGWLLAIAEDDIIVDFDVVDKPYADIKAYFNKYIPKCPANGAKIDTVKTLVWPCLRRTNGEILEKGEVIVVAFCETEC